MLLSCILIPTPPPTDSPEVLRCSEGTELPTHLCSGGRSLPGSSDREERPGLHPSLNVTQRTMNAACLLYTLTSGVSDTHFIKKKKTYLLGTCLWFTFTELWTVYPGLFKTWFIHHLVYLTPGLSKTWFIRHLVYPTPGLSDTWFIQNLVYPTPGLSDTWFIQHLVYLTPGLSKTWFIRHLVYLTRFQGTNEVG